ncbi:hypothetical protein PENSUB_7795 [Penicillium subrubescens]|uniref:Uncharacterized protein n=2 Tax=Penicillium subrubescens TaxID=1316194 RepID=A0A1Q5TJD7_9EURO|nr:hypothetical protein PENSUB_7795 [Penicillium subrubescens]
MEPTPMDIDSQVEYDFKYDPMQDLKPVQFSYNPSSNQENSAGRCMLPLDIFWTMLDQCLFKYGNITLQHEAFHSVFSLSQVDRRSNQYVEEYVARRKPQHFLRRELGDIELIPYEEGDNPESWYPGHAAHFPIHKIEDFLGKVIQADCPSCFAYLLDYCGMDIGHCNCNGWSFAALAVASRTIKILEYMLINPGLFHTLVILLLGPANVNFPRPTPLGLFGRFGDREFLDQVLDLVEDRLANLMLPSVVGGAFTADDIIWLCTYISPNQARRLQALGVPVTDACDSESKSTSWHGAVLNDEDFLEYMRVTSPMSPYLRNKQGKSPLSLAISQDRLDVVQWFKTHGLAKVSQEVHKTTELTVAMEQTSEDSAYIVYELLSIEPGTSLSPVYVSALLYYMVVALHTKDIEMRSGAGDYDRWRAESEVIAAEKCRSVLAMSNLNDLNQAAEDDLVLTIKYHQHARLLANELRFEELAKCVYRWVEES